jgi:hypothetical protein
VLVFEVLLVAIGVLVLIGLLLVGRSRKGGSDPSTSVDAFHRALTAMEPGADGGEPPASTPERPASTPERDAAGDDETAEPDSGAR